MRPWSSNSTSEATSIHSCGWACAAAGARSSAAPTRRSRSCKPEPPARNQRRAHRLGVYPGDFKTSARPPSLPLRLEPGDEMIDEGAQLRRHALAVRVDQEDAEFLRFVVLQQCDE